MEWILIADLNRLGRVSSFIWTHLHLVCVRVFMCLCVYVCMQAWGKARVCYNYNFTLFRHLEKRAKQSPVISVCVCVCVYMRAQFATFGVQMQCVCSCTHAYMCAQSRVFVCVQERERERLFAFAQGSWPFRNDTFSLSTPSFPHTLGAYKRQSTNASSNWPRLLPLPLPPSLY